MRIFYKRCKSAFLLLYILNYFLPAAYGQPSASRASITAITPDIDTGQDYSPWLNDNLNDMVQSVWSPLNAQYIDVKLTLASCTNIEQLSLYDWQGVFTDNPVTIYALRGTKKTLLGTFTGISYLQWVDIIMPKPVVADAIIIHKYGNNIPQKIQVFGAALVATTPVLSSAIISFPAPTTKKVGDMAFDLLATSTNMATAITYTSSNPAVASVSNATGHWQVTVATAGTTTITASQLGNATYSAAVDVVQPLVVQEAPTLLTKIPIDPERWYQLTNSPDKIQMLFDGVTDTNVTNGWGRITSTYDSYYPLLPGETFSIESIKMFDGWGSNSDAPTTLSIITDSWQRIPIATFTGLQYGWVGPYPGQPNNYELNSIVHDARYLVVTSSWAYPTELELYGSYTLPTTVPVVPIATLAAQKQTKLSQCLGVNAFEWDLEDPRVPSQVDPTRLAAVKNFTGIRHYLDWDKLEATQGQYTFNPTPRGGWDFDNMYKSLQQEGIEVLACLKTLPLWMIATYPAGEQDAENVPVPYGRDVTLPASYIEQAKLAFQYAARYGRNTAVDPALLSGVVTGAVYPTAPEAGIRTREIGLNLIKYVECDNERDKWWKGRKAYQTPAEYAANLSAFYDGHKNTMGAGVGVKNADPTMQVVMGGLASPTPDYVRGMVDWCRQYRGYKADGSVDLCWDVINYHQYSNDAGTSQGGNATRGAAPEVSDAGAVAKAFVQMAHQVAGDMPVWITETGFDTNQGSPLKAIAVGSQSVQETQADWILRTALAYARWGVERAFFYQLYDDNPASSSQFGTMGLVNADKTPRLAAQYLSQANKLLGRYTYKETLNSDPLVDRYELNGRSAYALVVPDEKGRTASYTLNLGTAGYAEVYRPAAGSQTMTAQRMNLVGGQLTVQVTETPLFVLADAAKTTTPLDGTCSATGTILREQWDNVNGYEVASIPLQTNPNSTQQLSLLESAPNIGDVYGARIRGYLCPPQSGDYTFWIAGDDECELWVSTDDAPANKVKIAYIQGYTTQRQWDKYFSQKSAVVNLVAGQRYYVEVLHKEAWGEDQVSVAWQLPNGTIEGPIPGSRLSPYITANNANRVAVVTTTNEAAAIKVGDQAVMLTAAPNPFTDECNIQLKLASATSQAILAVYDAQGRLVQKLFSSSIEANKVYTFVLKAGGLSSGIYSIQLTTDTEAIHKRIVLTK